MIANYKTHIKYKEGVFKSHNELIRELNEQGKTTIYRVLSFGGGTQSSHLLEQHIRGEIDYDYVIFSDTGGEPEFIHEQVRYWKKRLHDSERDTPFIITHHKSMRGGLEEMLMRFIKTDYQRFQMPVYCSTIDENGKQINAGILPRQCTVDFKIVPVKQAARYAILKSLGKKENQKLPDHIGIIMDIGFSYDEIKRINTYRSPQFKYVYLGYPLVEENCSTQDSIEFLKKNNLPLKRSRCYFCPFNCSADRQIGMDWEEIINDEPFSFLKACWFDEEIRRVQASGAKRLRSIPYLHFSRKPLKDVFKKEYDVLSKEYAYALLAWEENWDDRIELVYTHGEVIEWQT